jgi:outer membrane protein assembly factor BamB
MIRNPLASAALLVASLASTTTARGFAVRLGTGGVERLIDQIATGGGLFQIIDTDAAAIARVQEYLKSKNHPGRISATVFDGARLPYIDSVVSYFAAPSLGSVPMSEVMRVLRPGGTGVVGGEAFGKPWNPATDEWTHYLHGPTNNAVANDTVVGPPRHMQWLGGPRWTRTHHKLNSVSSVVTAKGRLFYVVDQASAASWDVADKWMLVARDAFNGVKLWQRDMESWVRLNSVGFRSGPPQLPRLLVASGARVFAPLALSAPVTALDADTGRTRATYKDTAGAEEIVVAGGKLIVLKGSPAASHARIPPRTRGRTKGTPKQPSFPAPTQSIVCVDVDSGDTLWQWDAGELSPKPETLASDGDGVYVQVGDAVLCLDLQSGKERWTFGTPGGPGKPHRGFGRYVLVVADGVVLCNLKNQLTAIDAKTGKKLWETAGGMGFHAPLDVFVIDGTVWTGNHPRDSVAPPPVDDFSRGLDLRTGKVKATNTVMVDLQSAGHHHRCYREKATRNYIIAGKRGFEMMHLTGDEHSRNNWLRGTCQYGMLPANGLTYAPPHSCGCYMASKLWGFWALGPKRDLSPFSVPDARRLEKGPAFGKVAAAKAGASGWPQFKGGPLRGNIADTTLADELKPAWSAKLGGKLTQPVIAEGKVLAADIDGHTIHALNEADGKPAWSTTVSGRVDSPPAIHEGMALFGSADGRVYCLRLADGALVWSFLAAPADMRTVAMEQVESVWPVHGSVLVLDGVAYCSAGRSTWLDDGIALYGLDPSTGRIIHKAHATSKHPKLGEGKMEKPEDPKKFDKRIDQNLTDYRTYRESDRSDAFSMEGGTIRDVLVSDGHSVFLHTLQFDATLQQRPKATRHLFSTSGLLDDTENHRSHWVLGTGDFSEVAVAYSWIVNGSGNRRGNAMTAPTGLMMAYDEAGVYAVKRGRGAYTVFKTAKAPFLKDEEPKPDFQQGGKVPAKVWQQPLPCRPRALLKAGDRLYVGGLPAAVREDPKDKPGALAVVSAADGKTLSTATLDSAVRWDGMAAASGRLYLVTESGQLQCWK